jgi:hypothetical protein
LEVQNQLGRSHECHFWHFPNRAKEQWASTPLMGKCIFDFCMGEYFLASPSGGHISILSTENTIPDNRIAWLASRSLVEISLRMSLSSPKLTSLSLHSVTEEVFFFPSLALSLPLSQQCCNILFLFLFLFILFYFILFILLYLILLYLILLYLILSFFYFGDLV